jgi:anti-sigma regulatory factor (Ser/Thr protein kinase)
MNATGRSLCLAAELENLAAIRNFVQESAAALGVDQAVISDVVLAADEAVTNVILHGYQGRQGTIEIESDNHNCFSNQVSSLEKPLVRRVRRRLLWR